MFYDKTEQVTGKVLALGSHDESICFGKETANVLNTWLSVKVFSLVLLVLISD